MDISDTLFSKRPKWNDLIKLSEILDFDIFELLYSSEDIKLVKNEGNKDQSVNGFEIHIEGDDIKNLVHLLKETISELKCLNERLSD